MDFTLSLNDYVWLGRHIFSVMYCFQIFVILSLSDLYLEILYFLSNNGFCS